jgi:segregation and condensation protein B
MEISEAKLVIESLLFVGDEPLSIRKIKQVVEELDESTIRQILAELRQEYDLSGRAMQLIEIANGYQLTTRPKYASWVTKLVQSAVKFRLTKAALETLTIIAYRQPVLRAEIEQIRGVDSGGVIQTLLEKKLIRVTGRKEVVGRPLLYGTTQEFLDQFGLKNLGDLPMIEEVTTETTVSSILSEAEPILPNLLEEQLQNSPDVNLAAQPAASENNPEVNSEPQP